MYMHEDIPSPKLSCKSHCYIETASAEINLKKSKLFLNGSYNPHRNSFQTTLIP